MNTPPVQNISDPPASDFGAASKPWFKASDIARAVKLHKKTIQREARRRNWPSKWDGNREVYQVPPEIEELIIAAPVAERGGVETPRVKFSDLIHADPQREKVLRRERAVMMLRSQLYLGKEVALETVAATMRATYADFDCSARALRRWDDRYTLDGIDGLVEQKRGVVGIKPFADDLSQNDLLRAAASAVGHGQWKRNKTTERLNKAAAFRELVSDPTIRGEARQWLHGARASKSAYPPSFGKRIAELISPLGATMLQVGKKAARLDGPFTNADYSDDCAKHAITADDMTANCYVWTEWGNDRGFVLVRPQILAVLHIGSLCWLNSRGIISARRIKDGGTTGSSVYDKDDVFGVIGDTLDEYGVFSNADACGIEQPEMTFIFEGGIWQNPIITGRKVLPDDEVRFGGLRSMGKGMKVVHTRTPLGKATIEGAFHVLQATADDVPGYTGRDARHDMPEQTKANLARVKAGEHPRTMFLHISEYNAHLQTVMHNLNTTRNDGKICCGLSPLEKFRDLQLRTVVFPDRLKWMYRSSYAVEKITRNGFRITRKVAGLNMVYEYDHPALENYRGVKLCGFWNDSNPDTDAVIYSIKNGKPDQLICVASRVSNPSRVGASKEEMEAEATRKSLKVSYASSQARQLAPFLQRNVKLAALAPRAAAVGDKIEGARRENDRRMQSRRNVQKFEGGAEELLACNPGTGVEPSANLCQEASQDESVVAARSVQPSTPLPPQHEQASGEGGGEDVSGNITPGNSLEQTGKNKFTYHLAPSGTDKARYVDYLLNRLTEFRKAGASFGQKIGNVSIGVTRKISQSHLGCDVHNEARFDDACRYLKGKIDATILGKRNSAKGTSNYHEFEQPDLSASALLS